MTDIIENGKLLQRRKAVSFLPIAAYCFFMLFVSANDLKAQDPPKPDPDREVTDTSLNSPSNNPEPLPAENSSIPSVNSLNQYVTEAPNQGFTFWLLDQNNGQWKVPLPNWSEQDVMQFIDTREEQNTDTPYTIQSINVKGTVIDDIANLTIQYRINTTTESTLRIPLELPEGVYISDDDTTDFSKIITYSGPSVCNLDIDPATGGYIAVLANSPVSESDQEEKTQNPTEPEVSSSESQSNDTTLRPTDSTSNIAASQPRNLRHTLTIKLSFQVETTGNDEYRLRITFPPAVHSKMKLHIPLPDILMTVSQGVVAAPPINLDETTSEITINGLNKNGETTEISWRKKEAQFLENKVIQVEDAVITAQLGIQEVTYDVILPVRTFGGETDVFRIRFPNKTTFVKNSMHIAGSDNNIIDDLHGYSVQEISASSFQYPGDMVPLFPSDTGNPNITILEVHLKQKVQSVTLQFKARTLEQPAESNVQQSSLPTWELNGFCVLGAQKQYGNLKIQIPQDLNFNITPVYGIRKNQETTSMEEGMESYTFFSQPFSLKAQAIIRQVQVNVNPEYQFYVNRDQCQLQARLQYVIYGAKVQNLRLKLDGWILKDVKPDNIVDIGRYYIDNNTGETILPLKTATEGTLDIELTAVRPLFMETPNQSVIPDNTSTILPTGATIPYEHGDQDSQENTSDSTENRNETSLQNNGNTVSDEQPESAESESEPDTESDIKETGDKTSSESDAGETTGETSQESDPSVTGSMVFEMPIPYPIADWVEPATVIVIPDDNIKLTPVTEKLRYLIPKTQRAFALNMELPTRQQPPLFYQIQRHVFNNTGEYPVFTSQMDILPQSITVESKTEVQLLEKDEETKPIQQTLTYHIKHEPVDSLSFLVPSRLLDNSSITVLLNGKAIPPQDIQTETINAKLTRKKINLASTPQIGTCTLIFQYTYPPFEFQQKMSNRFELYLIQPEEGALFSNQITVYTPPGLDLAPLHNSQPWVKEQTGMTTNGQQKFYHFSSETKQQQIILRGTLRNKDIQGTTVIDRAWIQTWISHNSRLDRGAYHITSDQPYLTITLPENVQHDRLSVLLNNNPYILNENESLFDTEGNLVIAVDDTLKNKPFVLEISYFIDLNKTTNKWLMDFPRFVNGSVWIRHSYWQVILPSHIHIINDIPGWTAEYINDTEWSDFHWKRVPSMDQQELCSWIGVKQREVIPAETSVYLYSTFNQIQQSRLPVIDRAYLILIGSGLSLIIGLGFLYFPLVRYRGSLLVLILLLISFFTYRPLITFVLLQTTVFGILLTGLTLFFIKIFGKKEAWPQRTPDLINIQEMPVNYPSMDIPTSSVPTMTLNDRQEETEIKNPQ